MHNDSRLMTVSVCRDIFFHYAIKTILYLPDNPINCPTLNLANILVNYLKGMCTSERKLVVP